MAGKYKTKWIGRRIGRGRRGFPFAAVACVLMAGVYVLGAVLIGGKLGGDYLAQRGKQSTPVSAPAASAAQSPAPEAGFLSALQEEGTEEVLLELPEKTIFVVAAGPYVDLSQAGDMAKAVILRGAAGYVHQDEGQYFVLLSAYSSQEAAQTVAARLDGQDGMALCAMELGADGVSLLLETSPGRANGIKNSYSVFDEAMAGIANAWKELDKGEITTEDAAARVAAIHTQLEESRSAAFSGALLEGDAQALEEWNLALLAAGGYLQTISSSDGKALSFSAKIKYTYIACMNQYLTYMKTVKEL